MCCECSIKTFFMSIVFGILLPTSDIVTDILACLSAMTLYEFHLSEFPTEMRCYERSGICDPKTIAHVTIMGCLMILPMIANICFGVRHWYSDAEKKAASKRAIPLVLAQFYPQWKLIQLLKKHWKTVDKTEENKKQFEKEKLKWEQDVGLLEPLLESVFQVSHCKTYVAVVFIA